MDQDTISGTAQWHPTTGGVLTYRIEMVSPDATGQTAATSNVPPFSRLYSDVRLNNKQILFLIRELKKAPPAKQGPLIQQLTVFGAEVLPYALDLAEQQHVRFFYPIHEMRLPIAFVHDYRIVALRVIESVRDPLAIPDLKRFLGEQIDLAAAARHALLQMPGPVPPDVNRALDERGL